MVVQPFLQHTRRRAAVLPPRRISASEYHARRERFVALMKPNSVALFPAADDAVFSNDIMHPHRQDSLFYHLFGLRQPMRRMLAPPGIAPTAQVPLTLALLAKTARGASRTLLFVPEKTTTLSELVWATEPHGPEDVGQWLATPSLTEGKSSDCRCGVYDNHVSTVAEHLMTCVEEMTLEQLASLNPDHPSSSSSASLIAPATSRELRRYCPLPSLSVHYPLQRRLGGPRYRVAQKVAEGGAVAAATALFDHPLDALLGLLTSRTFTIDLPVALEVKPQHEGGQPILLTHMSCSYAISVRHWPSTASYTTALPAVSRFIKLHADEQNQFKPPPATTATLRLPLTPLGDEAAAYRAVKSPPQVGQHLRSAHATAHAFWAALCCAGSPAGLEEAAVHAALDGAMLETRVAAARDAVSCTSAYIPVVASGPRALEVHYTGNTGRTLVAGDLLRLDAGVELDGVPTDCTRTMPVGQPAFCHAHRAAYDALLRLQRDLLRRMRHGVRVGEVAQAHVEGTQRALAALGLCFPPDTHHTAGDAERPSAPSDHPGVPLHLLHSLLCPHAFGHFFGLDIHDVSPPRALSADGTRRLPVRLGGGMMHTVEPGFYLPDEARLRQFGLPLDAVPAALRGLGLQIEDDVFVLPPKDATAELGVAEGLLPTCPWSRADYLREAVDTMVEVLRARGDAEASHAPSHLDWLEASCSALPAAGGLAPQQRAMVAVVFEQRVALEGLPAALHCVAADVAAVLRVGETETAPLWYPFDCLVLTACIPKDRLLLEEVMKGGVEATATTPTASVLSSL